MVNKMSRKKLTLTPRKKIVLGLLVLLSAVLTIVLFSISAASGQLRLTSSTESVVQGKTFTVNVNVSSDAPINVAHSKITYNSSALSLQSISYSGSPYTADSPEKAEGAGFVTLSRYKVGEPYPSGNFKLATLTFRANSTSGNTTINISQNDSYLYDAEAANALTSVSGVTVALTRPPTTNPNPNPSPSNPSEPTQNQSNNSGSSNQNQDNNPQPATNPNETDGENDAEPALINEETPDDVLPAPGTSQRSSSIGLADRLGILARNVLPVIVVLSVIGVIGWIVFKKFGHHTHLAPFTPAQAAGPGVVFDGSHTVKTNNDQNQQPPLSPIQ